MKKILLGFLMLLAFFAKAQNFEGTIKMSMKMDITDPATKAKMEEAQKKAQSPENQAKMKAMQDKLNDPQFKAMMDANPQMKAQMEAAMKMAGGGDASMAPSGLTIEIKGDNALTKIEGGAFPMEVLYLNDKSSSYMINRDAKTYSVLPAGNRGGEPAATAPKITKTSETTKVLGYNCTKYIVEVTEHGRTITQNIWATTELKNIDFKRFAKAKMGRTSLTYEGLDGFPMRVENKDPNASMTMEVTEIKASSLPATDFVIPADFKETVGMFGRQ